MISLQNNNVKIYFFNIIIIIITLFQEDNIFGRVASLTYGPQLTNVGHDTIKMNRHACTNIYSMYRVNALRTPSTLRAGYPTLLQWRGWYDFSRLKTSRVLPHTSVLVIKCFLTRSMLFLKCIYTHYIQSFFFTCTISETLFKLITHCFCCLLRCVEFSRSLTMSMHNVARLSVLHCATVVHAVNTPGKSMYTG